VVVAAVAVVGLVVAAVPAMAGTRGGQVAGAGPGHLGMMGGRWGGSIMASVAELLGMTQADLAAERQAGKSLADIAAGKGVDEAKVVEAVVADRKANLDGLVKAGRITPAHADAALSAVRADVTANIERTTVGRPENAGQGYGRGGRGRGMGPGANGICPFHEVPSQTPSQSNQ
jgi:hypothetical protein